MRSRFRIMLVWAGAIMIDLASTMGAESVTSKPTQTVLHEIRYALFLLVVLVGIFLVSLFAFKRWSKHFRRRVLRKPAGPTPAEDIWAMHRLPEEEPDDPDEEDRP